MVAALAERHRNGREFADLSDERVTAGLFALQHGHYETHAGIEGLQQAQELELERMGQHREGRSFFPMMNPVTTAQRIDPVEGFSKTRPAKGRQTAKQRKKWIS